MNIANTGFNINKINNIVGFHQCIYKIELVSVDSYNVSRREILVCKICGSVANNTKGEF